MKPNHRQNRDLGRTRSALSRNRPEIHGHRAREGRRRRYESGDSHARGGGGTVALRRRSSSCRVGVMVVESQCGASNTATAFAEFGGAECGYLQPTLSQLRGKPRCPVGHRHRGAVADQVQREARGLVDRNLDQVEAEVVGALRLGRSSAAGQ